MPSCCRRPRRPRRRSLVSRPRLLVVLLVMSAAPLLSPSGCGQSFDPSLPTTIPAQVVLPDANVEVPVAISGNLIFVDVTVNGAGPYKFLLDTGAALGQVSPAISAQFPANRIDDSIIVTGPLGETNPVPLFRVDSLKIGDADFQTFLVAVRDVPGMFAGTPFPVDGILGSGLFRHVLLTMDYPGEKIRVESGALPPTDNCEILPITGGDLGPGSVYILPSVSITLEGQTVSVFLDSGNAGALLLPNSYASLPFESQLAPVATFTQNGQTILLHGVLDGAMTLGCIEVDHPTILIGGNLASLGGAGLQSYVITLDQESKAARFVQPEDVDTGARTDG